MSKKEFVYPVMTFGSNMDWWSHTIDSGRVILASTSATHYDRYLPFKDTVMTAVYPTNIYRPPKIPSCLSLLNPEDGLLHSILKEHGIQPLRIAEYRDTTLLYHLAYGKKYVLKAGGSSRSIGKAIVDRQMLKAMVDFLGDSGERSEENGIAFNQKFGIETGRIFKEEEKYRLYYALKGDRNVYIQEYVDIDEEFRYYYFNTSKRGSRFVYKRFGCRLDVKEEEDTYRVPKSSVPKELLTSLDAIARTYKVPWMSVDIFKDKNGNWGVFEIDSSWQYDDIPELIRDMGDLPTDAMIATIREVNPYVASIADYVNGKK